MQEETILDEIERQVRRHCVFDKPEKYVANVLWIVGSYFLKPDDIRVFDAFPMLAFMSPEPGSGKTQALEITGALACNAIPIGSHTPASILAKIDAEPEKIITICLDEVDTIFSYGKDASDLVRLFNHGYKRGKVITRMKRHAEGFTETPAYCPKAFAGLSIARIPEATKTRTIIINMRPKTEHETVERYTNLEALQGLRDKLTTLSQDESFIAKLRSVSLGATFLNNRDQEIWEPLLAIAKVISEEWYKRGLKAAQFFTSGKTDKNLSRRILLGAYRVFRSAKHLDRIHSITLLEELHELGVPKWVDQNYIKHRFEDYDPEVSTRQMQIKDAFGKGINRNGYDWHKFEKAFQENISEKEIEEVEKELNIRRENVSAAAPAW